MVNTHLMYLSRDPLYAEEKPFAFEFPIRHEGDGVRRTNLNITKVPVTIHDLGSSNTFTIDANGFCVLNEETNLDVTEALRDPETVEHAYLEQLEAILHKHFPEYVRLEPFDFAIRVRDERFPSESLREVAVKHEQPACLAHSDYSSHGAVQQLKCSFPGQEEYFEGRDFDMINIWRPLVGPNDDWPLAVCDFATIDPENDTIVSDRVNISQVLENQLLFPNPKHRWYYIKGQRPSDLLVFRNTDATGKRARSFHASFPNPDSFGPPRQSCEARFVAFRN